MEARRAGTQARFTTDHPEGHALTPSHISLKRRPSYASGQHTFQTLPPKTMDVHLIVRRFVIYAVSTKLRKQHNRLQSRYVRLVDLYIRKSGNGNTLP